MDMGYMAISYCFDLARMDSFLGGKDYTFEYVLM